ncbi:TIGR02301 family protein [Roseibium sediminicola]|uniref:TIGR02301 family protein n=1 Tax=Roseibium sediminicola TaxID=2933272 RepID=A0ABT0GP36_9HYPH|nr:TIGR02301 family protein [Roseibium sp. CAU 1639]MCK7610857.1 TIGR02301 family protein [Roseibium sp. CAU 1639]
MSHRRLHLAAFRTFLVLAAVLVCPVQVVIAQEVSPDAPPYEQQLMRLSEIFGALHFLRPLCKENDVPSWRDQMEDFLDAETLDENRRRRFIERFNQGYRGFSVAYRDCTDAARLAMGQYLSEGETIITDVTSRYGR